METPKRENISVENDSNASERTDVRVLIESRGRSLRHFAGVKFGEATLNAAQNTESNTNG